MLKEPVAEWDVTLFFFLPVLLFLHINKPHKHINKNIHEHIHLTAKKTALLTLYSPEKSC